MKRIFNFIGDSLTPASRKRQRMDSHVQSEKQLVSSSPISPPASVLDETTLPPASGFLDLTSSHTAALPAESSRDTPLFLSLPEGAIRDPLGRTSLVSSRSTAFDSITDTRSSSEEAAEMQIQRASPLSESAPAIEPAAASDSTNTDDRPDSEMPANADLSDAASHTAKIADVAAQTEKVPLLDARTDVSATVPLVAAEGANGSKDTQAAPSVVYDERASALNKEEETEPGEQNRDNDEDVKAKQATVNDIDQPGQYQLQHAEAAEQDRAADFEQSAQPNLDASEQDREKDAGAEQPVESNAATVLEAEFEPTIGAAFQHEPPPVETSLIADSHAEEPVDDGGASQDVQSLLPSDADVDHVQMIADAKVGDTVEGLLEWSRTLRAQDPQLPSAPISEAGERSPGVLSKQVAPGTDDAVPVVDLVSDSEEEDSDRDDPDKENDVSLVNLTPRLDSDASLVLSSDEAAPSRASRSRHSLVGPMAQDAWRKHWKEPHTAASRPYSPVTSRVESTTNASATEQIRSIGRQSSFYQPSRRFAPHSSTPQQSQRAPARERSLSSTSTSSMFPTRSSSHLPRDGFRKRDPIYLKQHLQAVGVHNEASIRRSISIALQRINDLRKATRRPMLKHENFVQLLNKKRAVAKLLKPDSRMEPSGENYFDQMTARLLRQREADASALLPLPPAKLLERERLKREERARLKKLRGVLGRTALPDELTDEQEEAASLALRISGRVAEMTGDYRAAVDDKDVSKLRPRQWLNDEVINFYGNLVLKRADDADRARTEAMEAAKNAPNETTSTMSVGKGGKGKAVRPYDRSLDAFWRVHFFSSFFWPGLQGKGYAGVKRWTRRTDLFTKDIVLFPINLGNQHWVCGAINLRKHRFEYYDSLGQPNEEAFRLMRHYIAEEAKDKKKKEIDLRGWRNVFSDESPQQENGFDCGVFAAQTLEQISRRDPHTPIPLNAPVIQWKGESLDEGTERLHINGADGGDDEDDDDEYEWNFAQENMPYLRRRMAYEIYSRKLLD